MIRDLILRNRSYRRFHQDLRIERKTLEALVDAARLTPSAGNVQPLRYIFSWDEQKNSKIFQCLA